MATNRVSPKKGKVVDIPTVPTVGTATAGAESATVAYTASTIGGPATTFTALSNPGSITGSGSSSPITVSGLTGGTAYTFTVRGTNATGSSEYSSASGSVTPTTNTSYESIATVNVGAGGSSSISFSSIPGTYKHLQIRAYLKDTTASNRQLTFNGIGSGYFQHRLEGSGTAASTEGYISQAFMSMPITGAQWGAVIADFLDYTDTNKNKTVRILGGHDNNGYGFIGLTSGSVANTAAITSITIAAAGTWQQYSSFGLYGIKGA